MDLYLVSLLLGGTGLGAMAASGIGRHADSGHGHSQGGDAHAHGGHAGGHGGHAGSHGHDASGAGSHGHALTGGGAAHTHHGGGSAGHAQDTSAGHPHDPGHIFGAMRGAGRTGTRAMRGGGSGKAAQMALALVSPKVLFSVLLGLGTTGLVLRGMLGGPTLLLAAAVGGVAFERLVVSPVWNFMLRFASRPALTLESVIAEEATAVTSFDANGEGLVSVELDGQVVQVLGTLQRDDRVMGARVRAGDRVRIEDVDTARNRCTVSVR